MIRVYHFNRLTEAERKRLNSSDGGWDSEPRFSRYATITMSGDHDAVREGWSLGEYTAVAEVATDELEHAYMLTNHIDSDWTGNDGVELLSSDSVRSSSVGDVFELGGDFFVVANFGFKAIHLPS